MIVPVQEKRVTFCRLPNFNITNDAAIYFSDGDCYPIE